MTIMIDCTTPNNTKGESVWTFIPGARNGIKKEINQVTPKPIAKIREYL